MKGWGYIFSIFILLTFLSISSVSAGFIEEYNIIPFNQSTEIEVGEVSFLIPEGFGNYSDKNASDNIPDRGSERYYEFFMCDDGGKIHIFVINDFLGMSLDDVKEDGANKTTINGKEGWSFKKDNMHYFSYVDGDSGIYVGATNQSRIPTIIS